MADGKTIWKPWTVFPLTYLISEGVNFFVSLKLEVPFSWN